jgi:hypothetical protein
MPQNKLAEAEAANAAQLATNEPTVGKYLHYLADALLIREFRKFPLARKASARVPAKTDAELHFPRGFPGLGTYGTTMDGAV